MLREAAAQAEARFLLIQIMVRGHLIEEGSEHFLIAGEDRFALLEPAPSVPPFTELFDKELSVVASVDDSSEPVQLKIVQAKPAAPESAAN